MEKNVQLIDVRSKSEYLENAIPGAKNIPINSLKSKCNELDNQKPVIVYCHSGGRSAKAQSILQQLGFFQVYNGGSLFNFHIV